MDIANKIVDIEWEMFQKVNNIGGMASCQNNYEKFKAMRLAQILAFNEAINNSYYNDLIQAKKEDRNLLAEKYARMMYYTHSNEYEKIKNQLIDLDESHYVIVEEIAKFYEIWETEFISKYPSISKFSRLSTEYTTTDIYLKGEMLTYSLNTLNLINVYIKDLKNNDKNLVEMINYITMKFYGYNSLQEAEDSLKKDAR